MKDFTLLMRNLQRFRSRPHTTSETFEYAVFTLKHIFRPCLAGEICKRCCSHFRFVFEENSVRGNHSGIVSSSFSKRFGFKMILTTLLKLKAGIFKSSGVKSVYEKRRFRDGLGLTVGLIVKKKLRCQISWNVVWRRN